MKKVFGDYKIMLTTRQPKSLKNVFVRSRFDLVPGEPLISSQKENGLFSCDRCIYCKGQYIVPTKEFRFGRFLQYKWIYRRHFTCNSINVIYVLICNYCWYFYIGQTGHMKTRTYEHKSDVHHPENSYCRKLSNHLRECSKCCPPYFKIYPIYYEDCESKRRYLEKIFIRKYKPPLNSDH